MDIFAYVGIIIKHFMPKTLFFPRKSCPSWDDEKIWSTQRGHWWQ